MAQSEDVLTNFSHPQQMELHQYNFNAKRPRRGLPIYRKPQFMLPFTAEEQAQQAALWQHSMVNCNKPAVDRLVARLVQGIVHVIVSAQ